MESGLSEADAAAALAALGPVAKPASSRSYGSIVRANVLTVFNVILAAFGAITLAFGDWAIGALALAGFTPAAGDRAVTEEEQT